MNQIVFASGEHLIAENLKTEFLTIGAGAVLKAPEGEYLALTVNGCVHPLAEGSYHGDVEITVAEPVTEETYPRALRLRFSMAP